MLSSLGRWGISLGVGPCSWSYIVGKALVISKSVCFSACTTFSSAPVQKMYGSGVPLVWMTAISVMCRGWFLVTQGKEKRTVPEWWMRHMFPGGTDLLGIVQVWALSSCKEGTIKSIPDPFDFCSSSSKVNIFGGRILKSQLVFVIGLDLKIVSLFVNQISSGWFLTQHFSQSSV